MTAPVPARSPLPPIAALPLAIAALSSALVPGCPAWAAGSLLAAIALRLLADGRRVEILAQPAAASLRALLPFGVAIGLFAWPPGAGEGAGAFLCVAFAVEGLTLVSPAGLWSRALLLGLSGVEIATVALRLDGPSAVAPVLAYAAALVAALAAFERSASPLGMAERDAGTRRVSAPSSAAKQRRIGFRATAGLLAIGLPFGFLLFCALPPSPASRAAAAKREAARKAADGESRGGNDGTGVGGTGEQPGSGADAPRIDPGAEWRTGARTRMRLGFVERIKNDPTPMLSVRFASGDRGPSPLRLRGLAYDVFTGTEWQRSTAASREARSLDGAAGAWQKVGPDAPPVPERSLSRATITDLAGQPEGPLFLIAEPARIRLSDAAEEALPSLAADGSVYARGPLPAGASYDEDARDAAFDPAAASAAASTALSAPILTYTSKPPLREEYLKLATEAVGSETRPAVRAQKIAAWLKNRCKYSLSLPELDRKNPVLDFLLRAKQGPCEYFASAETLLLRVLGHPARYVVGVRGGEWVDEDKAWLFRGTNAHGWCELWLDGLGWQLIDPTPADESAVDFDPDAADAAAADAAGGKSGRGWLSNLLGWGRGRPGFLTDVRSGAASLVSSLPPVLRYLLPAALAAALWLVVRRRRQAAADAALAGAGAGRALGPYGRALVALRDAGIARRAPDTPGEFMATAAEALPPAADSFRALTSRFEEEKYGERPATPDERRTMEEQADRVREAAKARRHGKAERKCEEPGPQSA